MSRILFLLLFLVHHFSYGQLEKKVLPRNINIPGKSQMAPSISGDGRSMLFLTDYTKSGDPELRYSYMTGPGEWSNPEEIPVINTNHQYHFLIGYHLSYDGNTIFFTSGMSYGIGSYDIWSSKRSNGVWSTPKNLGKPVNSASYDASPSVSPDGRYLYFMRCDQMSGKNLEGCKLMVAERRNEDYWNEPVELPVAINSGQAAFPVILPDGKSLIFSSSSSWAPGKHNFFITRKENNEWLKPVPVTPLGAENTIPFLSMPMRGEIMYMGIVRNNDSDICMVKLPEVYQPDKVMILQGKISDKESGKPLDAYMQIYNIMDGKLINFTRTDKGSFFMSLPSGDRYDIAVNAAGNEYTYFSDALDLDTLSTFLSKTMDIQLESLKPGASMVLSNIYFKEEAAELDERSLLELRRLFKLLQDNAHLQVEIGAYSKGIIPEEDPEEEAGADLEFYDTTNVFMVDSLQFTSYDSTDFFWADTVNFTDTVQHNSPVNLSEEKARAVVDFLVKKGISPGRITAKGYGEEHSYEHDTVARSKLSDEWLELQVTGTR